MLLTNRGVKSAFILFLLAQPFHVMATPAKARSAQKSEKRSALASILYAFFGVHFTVSGVACTAAFLNILGDPKQFLTNLSRHVTDPGLKMGLNFDMSSNELARRCHEGESMNQFMEQVDKTPSFIRSPIEKARQLLGQQTLEMKETYNRIRAARHQCIAVTRLAASVGLSASILSLIIGGYLLKQAFWSNATEWQEAEEAEEIDSPTFVE